MAYKVVVRSIINYAAPVWSTNLRDTNYRNIQYMQNEAPRISTGCHKMSSGDHLHAETHVLKVREHVLSAQYLARCLEPENVNNSITTRDTPKRRMKETQFTSHRIIVKGMMIAKDKKQHAKQSILRQQPGCPTKIRTLAPTRQESVRMLASIDVCAETPYDGSISSIA